MVGTKPGAASYQGDEGTENATIMKRPNFFILGAPKCGTTSLAHWLAEHPYVYLSPIKEPHYYCIDLANRNIQSPTHYKALFRNAGEEHLAVGEASTWYLFSDEAVPAIEQEHPEARYIVMTRDPISMAHSLHHHNLRVLHENRSSFEEAWALQRERAAGRDIPDSCTEPSFLQYKAACSLGSLLEKLYEQVAKEKVLHIPLEHMQEDPALEYQRVLNFLGVPDDGRQVFPVVNEARGYRSQLLQRLIRVGGRARLALGIYRGLGLARCNERPEAKEELPEAFRDELKQAFAMERKKLKDLAAEGL